MIDPIENPTEKSSPSPHLTLGKNICSVCGKAFVLSEYELSMPGTQDLESVYCPYCNVYNGEVFINGLARTEKADD